MATIKAYTDLAQSKKLTKILPIESADMRYIPIMDFESMSNSGFLEIPECYPYSDTINWVAGYLPCWSLAALLDILPKKIQVADSFYVPSIHFTYIDYWNTNNGNTLFAFQSEDSLVDVCVDMIEKLNELNLL